MGIASYLYVWQRRTMTHRLTEPLTAENEMIEFNKGTARIATAGREEIGTATMVERTGEVCINWDGEKTVHRIPVSHFESAVDAGTFLAA